MLDFHGQHICYVLLFIKIDLILFYLISIMKNGMLSKLNQKIDVHIFMPHSDYIIIKVYQSICIDNLKRKQTQQYVYDNIFRNNLIGCAIIVSTKVYMQKQFFSFEPIKRLNRLIFSLYLSRLP